MSSQQTLKIAMNFPFSGKRMKGRHRTWNCSSQATFHVPRGPVFKVASFSCLLIHKAFYSFHHWHGQHIFKAMLDKPVCSDHYLNSEPSSLHLSCRIGVQGLPPAYHNFSSVFSSLMDSHRRRLWALSVSPAEFPKHHVPYLFPRCLSLSSKGCLCCHRCAKSGSRRAEEKLFGKNHFKKSLA